MSSSLPIRLRGRADHNVAEITSGLIHLRSKAPGAMPVTMMPSLMSLVMRRFVRLITAALEA